MSNQRYCFDRDESCHWYLIPVELSELFAELVEKEDGWADERWQPFEAMRINCYSDYTFENPQRED